MSLISPCINFISNLFTKVKIIFRKILKTRVDGFEPPLERPKRSVLPLDDTLISSRVPIFQHSIIKEKISLQIYATRKHIFLSLIFQQQKSSHQTSAITASFLKPRSLKNSKQRHNKGY